MKVAVITNQEGQVGKSVLNLLLGLTFSQTQNRRAVILSTGNCSSLYSQCSIDQSQDRLRNTNIYRALMQNAALDGDELLNYADRIGKSNTFVFNLFNAKIEREQLEKLFKVTLNRLVSDLVLVEVAGDLNSEFNKEIVKSCNAVLYVFNPNRDSISKMHDYMNNYDKSCVAKTGYVCQQYCPNMISENHFVKDTGIAKRMFMYLPYNEAVVKACYNGELESLIPSIITGGETTINMRNKLLELMQYLFDNNTVKYIKGYKYWHL